MKEHGKNIGSSAQAAPVLDRSWAVMFDRNFTHLTEGSQPYMATFVALERFNLPNMMMTAIAEVPTAGFTEGMLFHKVPERPPPDRVLDFVFTAHSADGAAVQVISKVLASEAMKDYQEVFPSLRGVRVHGDGKGIRVWMLYGSKPPSNKGAPVFEVQKDGWLAMTLRATSRRLINTIAPLPPTDVQPSQHPFLSGSAQAPETDNEFRTLLYQSRSCDDYLARLEVLGFELQQVGTGKALQKP